MRSIWKVVSNVVVPGALSGGMTRIGTVSRCVMPRIVRSPVTDSSAVRLACDRRAHKVHRGMPRHIEEFIRAQEVFLFHVVEVHAVRVHREVDLRGRRVRRVVRDVTRELPELAVAVDREQDAPRGEGEVDNARLAVDRVVRVAVILGVCRRDTRSP